MFQERYLRQVITADLQEKMVFLGGPRQVGKTFFSQHLGQTQYAHPTYLNWDQRDDRSSIRDGKFEKDTDLLILDELHKYRQWKQYIKGLYDTKKQRWHILVTGSARLDIYRQGGDSLQGRYHFYRLHPFSLAELLQTPLPDQAAGEFHLIRQPSAQSTQFINDLFTFGGFPEPLFQKNIRAQRRWHNEKLDRLIKEDIREIEFVRDLSALQLLSGVLPQKVGSRLSLNSLREDFEVAHRTMALWIDIFERFYYLFRISPFSSTAIKALRKEQKMYLWDWSEIQNQAARLENMVAAHLLKFTHWLYDAHGYRTQLCYLRDSDGHEVDFLVTVDQKPWFAVEVKWSEQTPAKHLLYYAKRLHIPYLYQLVWEPNDLDIVWQGVRVISVEKFLTGLV